MKKMSILINGIFIVLAIVSFIYGIIVKSTNSGTLFFLIWICIGIGLVAIASLNIFGITALIPKIAKRIIAVAIAIVLVIVVIINGLLISKFSADGEKNLDYIIVLGAQVKTTGPSVVLKHRLNRACEYLNDNPSTICIVSGGQGKNEPATEASVMKSYLVEQGISPERIIEEDKSTTTDENIKFSKTLMKPNSTGGIVTNNFHVYRALLIAKRNGLDNPSGIAAYTTPLFLPNNMLREDLALIKEFIK